MGDKGKTKDQLINELKRLRQHVAELEASEAHHKQVERELRESEDRFRKFADEASFEGIIIHDEGKILDVNEQFVALYGYDRAELLGMNVLEAIAPEYWDVVLKHVQEGYEKPYEAVALRKDGSTVPIEVHAKTIPYHGKTVRAAAVRDLTERKRAEEAIREVSRQRLQSCNLIAHELRNTLTKFGFFFSAINSVMGFLREQWELELRRALPALEEKGKIVIRLSELLLSGQPQLRDHADLMPVSEELLAEQEALATLFLLPQQGESRLNSKIAPKWQRLLAESRVWENDKEVVLDLLRVLEKAIWNVVDEDLAKKVDHVPEDLRIEWPKLAYTKFSANNLGLLEDVLHLLEHPAVNLPHKRQVKKLLVSLKALADIISIIEERTNRMLQSLKSGVHLEEMEEESIGSGSQAPVHWG
jgi:PAS domain S-box-containing protein